MSQRLALLAAAVLVGLVFGPGAQPDVTSRTAARLAPASALPAPSPSLSSPSPSAVAASATATPSVPSRAPAPPAAAPAAAATPAALPRSIVKADGAWTTYHNDDGHTGYDPSLNLFKTFHNVATGWASQALDEKVYAEPLVYGGLVYAVTLNNSVYAINQTDGFTVWQQGPGGVLAPPQTTGWICGNVSPQGMLGTPVIDPTHTVLYPNGALFVVAFTSSDTYVMYGLDLTTGAKLSTTLITIPGFDWKIQQQRGALALRNGHVYVPFGGRAGDCSDGATPYHGYVVGVPTDGSTTLQIYTVADNGSGIWAAGGVVVDDATGNVFAATGNGSAGGCSSIGQNDAVVRLAASNLALQDYFMPQDWQAHWCQNDQDLGSAGPLLISPNLLFQAGKWGGGFLLDPNNLGGVDGQKFPSPSNYTQADVCFGNVSDATFGSFAYAAPYIYLECEGHGLVALHTDTTAPSFIPCSNVSCPSPNWHAGGTMTFGPPIVAGGAVWATDHGGSGLYAFDQATGAQLFHSSGFGVNRFSTPSEAGGHVYVAAGDTILSFNMQFGALPSSPEPQPSRGPVLPAPTITPAPTRSPVTPSSPEPPPTDR